jgi:hypothetical protein
VLVSPLLVVHYSLVQSMSVCSLLLDFLPVWEAGDSSPSVSTSAMTKGAYVMLILTAPVYSAELAPPGLRGLFVGMNGVNIALGYGLASYMGMGMCKLLR